MGKLFKEQVEDERYGDPNLPGWKKLKNNSTYQKTVQRKQAFNDYPGPEEEDFMRGKEGPTRWTKGQTDRARGLGNRGIKRNRTPDMWNRDRDSAHNQQRDMNSFLQGRAEGKNLISTKAINDMTNHTRAGIQSQAAGTGTSYNPALAQAATSAMASAGQNIAGAGAQMAAAEKAQAQKDFIEAQAARRGQNQAALGLGLSSEGQDADWRKFMENLGANYQSLGTSESFQDQANKQALADRYQQYWAMYHAPNQ